MSEQQLFGVRLSQIESLLLNWQREHGTQLGGSVAELARKVAELSNREIYRFVEDEIDSVGAETLADAVVFSVKQRLAPLVRQAKQLPIGKVREVLPMFSMALDTAVTFKKFLENMGANQLRLGTAYSGNSINVLAWPPIALQEEPRGPVSLLFWANLQYVLEIAETEVLVQMPADPCPEASSPHIATPQPGERGKTGGDFGLLHTNLHKLSSGLALLAILQWQAADVIGLMYGSDRCGLAWYRYAMDFLRQGEGRIASLIREDDLSLNFWGVVEHPSGELNLAGMALRYVLEQKPFPVPLLSVSGLEKVGTDRVLSCRIVANSPSLSHSQMANAAKRALVLLRGSRSSALSRSDRGFLDLARSQGLRPGKRVQSGFWPRFAEMWNKNPIYRNLDEKDLTPGAARTRWSRILKHLRDVYGPCITREDLEAESPTETAKEE